MNEHNLSCLVIRRNSVQQQKLLSALRAASLGSYISLVGDVRALKVMLQRLPKILFYVVSKDNQIASKEEQKLLQLIQRSAGDCVFVRVTHDSWQGLHQIESQKNSEDPGTVDVIDSCTLATDNTDRLQQHLNDLLAYVRLKTEFRQSKHLLHIAETRNQALTHYAREPIAYISNDKHLYANVAYLSLFGFNSIEEARQSRVSGRVDTDNRAMFIAAYREAIQRLQPSNKLRLMLVYTHGRSFRAAIRFWPAVYRGRRCLQLHVQPITDTDSEQADAADDTANKLANPWQEPVREHMSN